MINNYELTRLIVTEARNRFKHNSERQALAKVRNEYWIPTGKSFVYKVLLKFIVRRKFNARPLMRIACSNVTLLFIHVLVPKVLFQTWYLMCQQTHWLIV